MAKLSDVISVRDDIVFGGAVQVDWFYQDKSKIISENFVFHGPDFFGVTEGDVEFSDHKLMDTCTYTKLISDKLVTDNSNPIILTIAGYGTGKSHLAVTLGKLFENRDNDIVDRIFDNIKKADSNLADEIRTNSRKQNLILVLNGMRDFNLNIEILNVARKVLTLYGYTDEFFSDITKAYTISKIFVERNYELHKQLFLNEFAEKSLSITELREYIIDNIFCDEVFNAVNNVYEEINGTRIRWDEGITASDVLRKLNERLCGENGEFNKILILFDEFGRYIEFAADRPELAGDSALQQIYETIQDSDNNIILIGFIQSDLKAYMARVKKSSSIARYIGRYESGEKIYLSSNLETIFANLIIRNDRHLFQEYIIDTLEYTENEKGYMRLFHDINEWSTYVSSKGIWNDKERFLDVLVKGTYPMNPITVLLLTSLSDWYQQRSALNFFMDSIKKISNKEITKLGRLPQIYPTDIIKGDFFTELLLAEKEGRQRSENCMLFDRIIVKHGEKLGSAQFTMLSAILVYKLLKFRVTSKEELLKAFMYLTGINSKAISSDLEYMEEQIGIISYDEKRFGFDFVEDATGQNDFNVHFNRVRNRLDYITMEALITGEIKNKLGVIADLQTDFPKVYNIKTNEWSYKQEFKTINELDELYFKSLSESIKKATQVNTTRGVFVYVYLSEQDDCNKIVDLYKKYEIFRYPVVLWLLDDSEHALYKIFFNERVISSFSKEDKSKYSRFIDKFFENNDLDMRSTFKKLQSKREIITENGIRKVERRMKVLLKEKFEEIYPDIIPFPFEGFTNKQLGLPKKNLSLIAKSMLAGAINYTWIQVQDKSMRNIVSNVLVYSEVGWGVLNNNYELQYPTNKNLYKLFNKLDKKFSQDEKMLLMDLHNYCVSAPIGMNEYSFSLFLAVYLHFKGIEAKILYNDKIIKYSEWSTIYFKDKRVDLPILENSYVVKVNVEGYLKKYQLLCNEIEHELNLSRFEKLLDKLNELEKENDPPEELAEKVQACHMRLEVGINQLKDLRNKINNIKGEFNKGTDSRIDYKYLLNSMVRSRALIKNESQGNGYFEIPNDELQVLEKISEFGNKIIEHQYMSFLKKQKCMSVSGVGPYRKWLEKLAENLKALGYSRLCTETLSRMEITTGSIENIRKVQEAVEKCETYLKVTEPTQYSTQEELLNYQKEAELLVNLLKQNKAIDEISRGKYLKGLGEVTKKANERLEDIKNKITLAYDKAFEIKTIEDAEDTRSLIHELLEKGIRHEEKGYIEVIGRVITSCLNDLNDIRTNVELAHREARVKKLIVKYDEYKEDVDLNNMLNYYIEETQNEIINENKFWMEKIKINEINSVLNWNAQKCQSFMAKTEVLPEFLLKKNIDIIADSRAAVLQRLKELKIESVMELFKALEKTEQIKCVELLKSHIS